MARYTLLVLSNPVTGQEDEFNAWYTNIHILDLVKVPGIVAAQRFRRVDALSNGANQAYVAQYLIDTDDIDKTMAIAHARLGTHEMPMSDAFDMTSAVFLVAEAITEQVQAKQAVAAE